MTRLQCPKCKAKKGTWKVRRNNRVCINCRHEWDPKLLPLRLTVKQWKQILKLFILGLSSNQLSEQTGINKPRILRALMYARRAMINDVPKQFYGIVEVDARSIFCKCVMLYCWIKVTILNQI